MVGRLRGRLLLLLAGLLVQTGCFSLGDSGMTATGDEPGTKRETSLAPNKSIELHLALADKFEKSGKPGEAAAQLEMARTENPNVPGIDHHIALLYDAVGQLQPALEDCQKRLALEPKNVDLINDVGWCYYDIGSWSQAEKYFRQAVAVKPDYKRAWNNLGMTLGQQERYAECMEAFAKVVRPSEAECNLAFIYLTQGKKPEARAAFERALQQDPNSQMAHVMLQKLDTGNDAAPPVQHVSAKIGGERSVLPTREPQPVPTDVYATPLMK